MNSRNADLFLLTVDFDLNISLADNRQIKLRGLVTLRQIRVEVIFSGKLTEFVNIRIGCKPKFDCKFNNLLIENREYPGETQAKVF